MLAFLRRLGGRIKGKVNAWSVLLVAAILVSLAATLVSLLHAPAAAAPPPPVGSSGQEGQFTREPVENATPQGPAAAQQAQTADALGALAAALVGLTAALKTIAESLQTLSDAIAGVVGLVSLPAWLAGLVKLALRVFVLAALLVGLGALAAALYRGVRRLAKGDA